MPNWCENDLVCQGKKVDLITLLLFVKGETDFDFNRIIPGDSTEWGVKWNADEIKIEPIEDGYLGGTVTIHFNTAWSPPREVILELSSYFPHILFTLSYYERGQSYYGKSKLINRRYIREIEGDYFGPRGG